jgi:hypothetical protein
MDWEDLHHAADLIAVLTAPAALTGVSILEWGRRMPRFRRIAGWGLVGLAVIFYTFDISDRFGVFKSEARQELIEAWNFKAPRTAAMVVNGRLLSADKSRFGMFLLAGIPAAN